MVYDPSAFGPGAGGWVNKDKASLGFGGSVLQCSIINLITKILPTLVTATGNKGLRFNTTLDATAPTPGNEPSDINEMYIWNEDFDNDQPGRF